MRCRQIKRQGQAKASLLSAKIYPSDARWDVRYVRYTKALVSLSRIMLMIQTNLML